MDGDSAIVHLTDCLDAIAAFHAGRMGHRDLKARQRAAQAAAVLEAARCLERGEREWAAAWGRYPSAIETAASAIRNGARLSAVLSSAFAAVGVIEADRSMEGR